MTIAAAYADLVAALRARGGATDLRERLSRKHRVRPLDLTAEMVAAYWAERARDIAGSWLDRLTPDEFALRLAFDRTAAVDCERGDRDKLEERLFESLKLAMQRGLLDEAEALAVKERVVAENHRDMVSATQYLESWDR